MQVKVFETRIAFRNPDIVKSGLDTSLNVVTMIIVTINTDILRRYSESFRIRTGGKQ